MNRLILCFILFIEKEWTGEIHIDLDRADEKEDKFHEIDLRLITLTSNHNVELSKSSIVILGMR